MNIETKIKLDKFLQALKVINFRDYLLAKTLLETKRRLLSVIPLLVKDISHYRIAIKRGKKFFEWHDISPELYEEILSYIQKNKLDQNGFLFQTRNKKKLTRTRLTYSFKVASDRCRIKITPSYLSEAR